jgi:IS30 family transposase
MGEEQALRCAKIIKEGLIRGLSPYEIATGTAEDADISESTMYRLVEAGVGGLANIDLERKVGFKPRRHRVVPTSTRHALSRSYASFLALSDEEQGSACEMDCVEGRRCDEKTLLTLYLRPTHLQIPLLLAEQTAEEVFEALSFIKALCPQDLFAALFSVVLTDNGSELSEEEKLDVLFGGVKSSPHLFYCDPRRSDQKARCEKNHSEIRQILPKGKTPFDELDFYDVATVCSHANSNPRRSLGGKSPIQLFKLFYGEAGKRFLDNLKITEVSYEDLTLKPEILDIERERRGLPPINWI